MTQALCCVGTEARSNADKIISSIQGNSFPDSFRNWVDNCLTELVDRVTELRGKDAVLLFLGHRTGYQTQKSAIQRLLKTARINNGVVSTNGDKGESLYKYLINEFGGRMGFLIHPANSTVNTHSIYFASEEGQKVRNLIEQVKIK